MQKTSRFVVVALGVLIVFIGIFQNCSPTSFTNESGYAYAEPQSGEILIVDKPKPNNSKIKIGVFLDESASMSQIKDRVANGMNDLFGRLIGSTVDLRILGINQIVDVVSEPPSADQTFIQLNYPRSLFANSKYNLTSSTVTTSAAQSLTNQIKTYDRYGGSTPYGRRALAQVLADTSSSAFFQPNDIAIAVLITDQNDAIQNDVSHLAGHYESRASIPAKFDLSYKATTIRFEYTALVPDGTVVVPIRRPSLITVASNVTCPPQDRLLSSTFAEYIALENLVREHYKFNQDAIREMVVKSCESGNVSFPYLALISDFVAQDGSNVTCQTNGIRRVNDSSQEIFSTIFDWLKSQVSPNAPLENPTCKINSDPPTIGSYGSNRIAASIVPLGQKIKMLEGANTIDDFIVARTQKLFPSGNFKFTAIVNTSRSDKNCPIQSEQNIGTNYLSLADRLGGNSFSICSPNYSEAIRAVNEFIADRTGSYLIDRASVILSAELVKARTNAIIPLKEGIDFTLKGSYITFINPNVLPGDRVRLKFQ